MTINDREVTERVSKIIRIARTLSELMARGNEHALAMALSDIDMNARDAQYRLNDMLYRVGKTHPLAEPMGS